MNKKKCVGDIILYSITLLFLTTNTKCDYIGFVVAVSLSLVICFAMFLTLEKCGSQCTV